VYRTRAAYGISGAHRPRGDRNTQRLNLSGCFAYAPTAEARLPRLFEGDDIGHTDIESALGR